MTTMTEKTDTTATTDTGTNNENHTRTERKNKKRGTTHLGAPLPVTSPEVPSGEGETHVGQDDSLGLWSTVLAFLPGAPSGSVTQCDDETQVSLSDDVIQKSGSSPVKAAAAECCTGPMKPSVIPLSHSHLAKNCWNTRRKRDLRNER